MDVTRTVLNRPIANPTISYRTNAYQTLLKRWKKTKEEPMTWIQACSESRLGTAVRDFGDGRVMLRNSRGTGVIETVSGTVRIAVPNELEGHSDWQPLYQDDERRRIVQRARG